MTVSRLFRTLRHTRPSQLFWRLCYTLERKRAVRPERWRWTGSGLPPVRNDFPLVVPANHMADGRGVVARLRAGEFRHLHWAVKLGYPHPDWRLGNVSVDRLWTVTLHYHEWADELAGLAAAGDAEAAALLHHYLHDWIARCPLSAPGARALAWNSYAIATRITWWVRAARRYPPIRTDAFLNSLWEQTAYLSDHLEWDLRANHLMRDAVGLVWAGRYFAGERAATWLRTGTQLAVEQAKEQVLPDGGHFERSPMYHRHVMEDVGSLAELVEDATATREFRDTLGRMAEFDAWVRHPDGQIPLFNDAALNGVDGDSGLVSRSGGRYFPDTGLAVWHGDPWSVFFDVGPVGPDYQPGHAHADTLTMECSYRGKRLIVDPGTYAYDNDDRRRYDRSTSAHNTVVIDGQDSSEVWHIFRVGRRAYPKDVAVEFPAGGMAATATHTGYDHLPGRPRHARQIRVEADGKFTIRDTLTGRGNHKAQGGYLLAPGWSVLSDGTGWLVRNESQAVRVHLVGPAAMTSSVESRPFHPEFGLEIPTTRLCWQYDGPLPVEVTTTLEPA